MHYVRFTVLRQMTRKGDNPGHRYQEVQAFAKRNR